MVSSTEVEELSLKENLDKKLAVRVSAAAKRRAESGIDGQCRLIARIAECQLTADFMHEPDFIQRNKIK